MKIAIIVLLAACAIGSSLAQDCSAKIQDFHKCLDESHKRSKEDGKAKFEAMKAKVDACYTDNGCTPPAKGEKGKDSGSGDKGGEGKHGGHGRHGNNTEGGECRKAFKQAKKEKFEACIKQAIPNFTLPPKDDKHDKPHSGGHKEGGHNHKDENKNLDGCAKKQAVRDCKRALFNSSRPTDAEKRAQFQARCDAKNKCLTALGADCQAQLEKFKKAACECRQQLQQQDDQIRAGIAACKDVTIRQGTCPPRKEHKQESCDRKDYCKLGYDALVQDHPKGKGERSHQ